MGDNMITKKINLEDLNHMCASYIEYFNNDENGKWTVKTVIKRFRQLVLREDYFGLGLFDNNQIIGFAVGCLTQFDDGIVALLNEMFISKSYQSKGHGSRLLKAFESEAKALGAFRVQLETADDEIHRRFYNDLNGYLDTTSNVLKGKMI
jgi:GNAT superfamily N-acetyltransferase